MAKPPEQLSVAPVYAEDSWLQAEIVGNGLWPQISAAIDIEIAHAVVAGGLESIKAFQGSVLSESQLAHWKKMMNNMHHSHDIDIQADIVNSHYTINSSHMNRMWNEVQEEVLKAIATFARRAAPELVEVPPYNRDDMKVITNFLDQPSGPENTVHLQNFFRTLHNGLHTKDAKKLAGRFKDNFRGYTSIDGFEKYQRETQNTRLLHRMAYGLIQHSISEGYEQRFVESFLFQAFDAFDPDIITLVSTLSESAIFTP